MKILIMVHPGSACGSAEFNIGRDDARAGRIALAEEMADWHGPVIVIDSDLSDELGGYPVYAGAIEACLDRNAPYAVRVGPHEDPCRALTDPVVIDLMSRADAVIVTGLWREDCVAAVVRNLAHLQPRIDVETSDRSLSIE